MQSTTSQEATMKTTATHLYFKAVTATAALASLSILAALGGKIRWS